MSFLLNQYMIVLVIGLSAGGLAIALRDAEERLPNPNDIAIRGGLSHMLTGVLAWMSIAATMVAGFYALGAFRPLMVAIALTLFLNFTHFGARLFPLYRLQVPLVLIALIAAFWLWTSLFSLIQGVS